MENIIEEHLQHKGKQKPFIKNPLEAILLQRGTLPKYFIILNLIFLNLKLKIYNIKLQPL